MKCFVLWKSDIYFWLIAKYRDMHISYFKLIGFKNLLVMVVMSKICDCFIKYVVYRENM